MPQGVLVALTVAIVAGVYVCALVVPAVEKVWALCGSSVCIAVAFILPTSYYLEVRAAKYAPLRKGAARVVLVAAVAMALVCTGSGALSIVRQLRVAARHLTRYGERTRTRHRTGGAAPPTWAHLASPSRPYSRSPGSSPSRSVYM